RMRLKLPPRQSASLRNGAAKLHSDTFALGPSMFDWSDLRYLLAVAEHGSTLAAARHLNVNQSTVQRRLAGLENSLGLRLVERSTGGYRLTTAGSALLPSAEG